MAHQEGTAFNVTDLLDKLQAFATTAGWQVARITKGESEELQSDLFHFHQNKGIYRNFVLQMRQDKLILMPTTESNVTQHDILEVKGTPYQPGTSVSQNQTLTSELNQGAQGALSYNFFATNRYVHVVCSIGNDQYRHFGFGEINKHSDFASGEYTYGTHLSSSSAGIANSIGNNYGFSPSSRQRNGAVLRFDNFKKDGQIPWYLQCPQNDNIAYGSYINDYSGNYVYSPARAGMPADYYAYHPDSYLIKYSQSVLGDTVMPAPNHLIAHKMDNTFVRVGHLPDRYETLMRHIAPKTRKEINGQTWILFPSAGYDEANSEDYGTNPSNTGWRGVAYRLVE